jgi:hypothetical protein
MTLVASILFGFPLGFWLGFRRRAQVIFGVAWAAILAYQSLYLAFDPTAPNYGSTRLPIYWIAQPAIFALGIALLWLGARVRARRHQRALLARSR